MAEKALEQVLADYREESQILRKHGAREVADAIARLCDEVAASAEDYTTWLTERAASLRSNHRTEWFRSRFAAWETEGNARWGGPAGRTREYRQLIVPQRPHVSASREAGRRAAIERERER